MTRDPTRRDLRPVVLYDNQVACTQLIVECIYFLNIHLSAIINADTDSLENA